MARLKEVSSLTEGKSQSFQEIPEAIHRRGSGKVQRDVKDLRIDRRGRLSGVKIERRRSGTD
jgi:hypothetical protein